MLTEYTTPDQDCLSSELIAIVLAEPDLETWLVDQDDSLASDADTVNT